MQPTRLPFDGAHWVDHLARHAYSIPDAVAIRFDGRSITWAALHARVAGLAQGLIGQGVKPGERVGLLMLNRPEFVESLLAINAVGAIAVPANFRLAPGELAYVLEDCDAAALITDETLAPLATAAGVAVPTFVTGSSYEALLEGGAPTLPEVEIAERDVALLMYTSGTTGRPKGAMLTHLNLLWQAITAIRTSRLFGDDGVGLINVPLFHIAGTANLAPPLLLGNTTVIMPTAPFDAGQTLEVVEREGVTGLFLVPAQWQILCAHPDATRRTQSLRTISWGAAPATVSLLETMEQTFPHAEIVSVFGQTEMSPVTTYLPPEESIARIGSVGKAITTIAARVVDDAGNDVGPNEVGEIVYRGPSLMSGYWNRPEATAEAFEHGWFHSGDLVRADDDGYLYVVDRKKDMIISGGENIYCAEVENALASHAAVADVAVIGIEHDRWGETPIAVVVPVDAAAPPTLTALVEWTASRLASYKKPTGLVIVEALPRNAGGKVLKGELRAAARSWAIER